MTPYCCVQDLVLCIWYKYSTLEHRGDFTQEADLVRGVCGVHGGYETAEVRHVRRIGGGAWAA